MSAVVVPPRSSSNPSDKFRVAEYQDWLRFRNKSAESYSYTEHDSWREAETERNDQNDRNRNIPGPLE